MHVLLAAADPLARLAELPRSQTLTLVALGALAVVLWVVRIRPLALIVPTILAAALVWLLVELAALGSLPL